MGRIDSLRFLLTGGRPAMVRQLYDLIRPQTYPGLKKLRVGNRWGDGGYVMVDDFSGIKAALSLGIGDEITWDVEMSGRGLDVFQFDHTVEPPAEVATNPRLHFYKCGIASDTDPQQNLKTIENILAEEMADCSGDLILKIDVEGHEWETLARMSDEVLSRFRQICIEIHNPLARP
ncbi:MAG: FkbM family methyltransferase, partial [Smithella sp.]